MFGIALIALFAFLFLFVTWYIPACDAVGVALAATFTPEQRQVQLDAAIARGQVWG